MDLQVLSADKNGDRSPHTFHDKNGLTVEGNNMLHIAARKGRVEVFQNMKASCLSVSLIRMAVARNTELNTPLHEAAKKGNADIVSALLKYNKCAASKRNQFGESPLIVASEHGHVEAVSRLLKVTPLYIILWPRNDRQTCLHVAAYGGHLEIVKLILGKKSFCDILRLIIMIPDVHGATPLHSAVHKGNVQIVNEILDKQSKAEWCVIKWLVKGLMRKKDKIGRCAIHIAATKGNLEMVDWFLKQRPDCLEILSDDLKTPLQFAVEHNKFDMVKKLLPQDKKEEMAELVKFNRDMYGNTLLHSAIIKGVDDPELVKYLLPFVNLDAINNDGYSAFDIVAAEARKSENERKLILQLVEYLLPFLNLGAINNEEHRAFDIAAAAARKCAKEPKLEKVKEILQDQGACESYMVDKPFIDPVDFKRDSNVPEKIIDVDTLVASLIATVTFAAIFTVPGGIDDKDSGNDSMTPGAAPSPSQNGTGVARMALETLFQVFLFSDSLAMFSSLTVVIAWLFRERLQTKLMSDRSLLPKLSVLSLGISIVSTGLAFLSASILVTVPRDSKRLNRDYESLLWGEIFTAFSAPALSLILLTFFWIIEYNFYATLEIQTRLRKQVKEAVIYVVPPLAVVLGIIIAFGYQYFS